MKTQVKIVEKLPNCEYFYRCKNKAKYEYKIGQNWSEYVCEDCYKWYSLRTWRKPIELVLREEYENRMKEEEQAKEEKKRKAVEMLDYIFVNVTYKNGDTENGREYWNGIPIMSKKGKYWKWGKVGFLYGMPYIVYSDGSVASYDPKLMDGTKGKIIMVYREWSAGSKISQMEVDCFVCGEEMKYGINADTITSKPYAFAICDVKKEYKTDEFRYIGFCKDCFQEVANIIVKNKFQQKNPIA
jgi:hypothetical protein